MPYAGLLANSLPFQDIIALLVESFGSNVLLAALLVHKLMLYVGQYFLVSTFILPVYLQSLSVTLADMKIFF